LTFLRDEFGLSELQLVKAIEQESRAGGNLTSNHKNAPMFVRDINVFHSHYQNATDYRKRLGRIDQVHVRDFPVLIELEEKTTRPTTTKMPQITERDSDGLIMFLSEIFRC
jgi:hypothetical protein